MVLDGVDVFVRVVQAGSFSGAARALGMPATTVSAKIARLEERLGVTLIQRSTRKMHVTDAGKAYYASCAEALRMLGMGEERLAAASGGPSGALRITASSDGAQQVLPAIIERFLARHAKISIELTVTNKTVDLLAEGIDLALRAGPMKDSNLQSRKYGPNLFALFASRRYLEAHGTPETPEDLSGHAVMVHRRFPHQVLAMSSPGGRFQLKPQSRVLTDDMQTLRALAAQGAGIALLPNFHDAMRAAELVRVLPGYGTQSGNLYFVYPASKFTPTNVKAFIDMAVGTAAAQAAAKERSSSASRS